MCHTLKWNMLYCAVTNFCTVGHHSVKAREYGTAEKRKKEGCGKTLYLPLGQANMNFSIKSSSYYYCFIIKIQKIAIV